MSQKLPLKIRPLKEKEISMLNAFHCRYPFKHMPYKTLRSSHDSASFIYFNDQIKSTYLYRHTPLPIFYFTLLLFSLNLFLKSCGLLIAFVLFSNSWNKGQYYVFIANQLLLKWTEVKHSSSSIRILICDVTVVFLYVKWTQPCMPQ